MVSASDDQIYERYQARAIAETNQLGHEIATWVGEHHPAQPPVIGTGHPLADIFLLKYRPQPAEVQEGVAFFGRAGQAVLKSIERLRIDPLKLYGSVCLKVRRRARRRRSRPGPRLADPRAAHHPARRSSWPWATDTLEFVNSLASRWRRRSRTGPGSIQRFTPTIDLLAVPDIDDSLNEADRQAGVLGRLQGARRVVREPAAVLMPPAAVGARWPRLAAFDLLAPHIAAERRHRPAGGRAGADLDPAGDAGAAAAAAGRRLGLRLLVGAALAIGGDRAADLGRLPGTAGHADQAGRGQR